jgi:hypothetical protein
VSAVSTETEQLKAAIRGQLALLWSDLCDAQGEAVRTDWSIRCENLAERITELTKLVGPTRWDEVPMPLLENGVYLRIHVAMGIEVRINWAEVQKIRREIDAQTLPVLR